MVPRRRCRRGARPSYGPARRRATAAGTLHRPRTHRCRRRRRERQRRGVLRWLLRLPRASSSSVATPAAVEVSKSSAGSLSSR